MKIMEAANLISVTVLVALTARMPVSAFTDFRLSVTQKNYQGELHGVVTMEWYAISTLTQGGMDLSRVEITCIHSGHHEYVYHRSMDGVENASFPNKYFNGRVDVDQKALCQGKIEVTIVNLTSEAAGIYQCAIFEANRERYEDLTLNITQKGGFSRSNVSSLGNEHADSPRQQRHHWHLLWLLLLLSTVITLGALVKWIFGAPDL